MPTTPAAAKVHLLRNPEGFLKTYPCRSYGAKKDRSVRMRYHIATRGDSFRPGSFWGTKTTTAFNVKPGDPPPYGTDGEGFWAHMITVKPSSDPTELYDVPNDDTNIIVTGALTSCSFVVQETTNGISCAHIQPAAGAHTGTETGEELHDRLLSGGYSAVYGKRRYDHRDRGGHLDREVTIMGVRVGDRWEIYAQEMEPTAQYRIWSVYRVYPQE
jgi:hypothetical protein